MKILQNYESLNQFKSSVKALDGNNIMYNLSATQRFLSAYVVATNLTSFGTIEDDPEFSKEINQAIKTLYNNATTIQNKLNPAINTLIDTMKNDYINFYDAASGHKEFHTILDKIKESKNLQYFKSINGTLRDRADKVIRQIELLQEKSDEPRAIAEKNARVSGGILTKANQKKTTYTKKLEQLNSDIKSYDETIQQKLAFISEKESTRKKLRIAIAISAINPLALLIVGSIKGKELSAVNVQIKIAEADLQEAQNNKKTSLDRIEVIEASLLTINAVIDKISNINLYSRQLTHNLLTVRDGWLTVRNLLTSLLEKFSDISAVDDDTPEFLKEIYFEDLGSIVNSLKEKIAIRDEALAPDKSFYIDIDPKINRYFAHFPVNSNGFITMSSDLICEI